MIFFVLLKLDWRLSHEKPAEDCGKEECNLEFRESIKCKIFLGFTSNLISSGIRETIRYLLERRMVRVELYLFFLLLIGKN